MSEHPTPARQQSPLGGQDASLIVAVVSDTHVCSTILPDINPEDVTHLTPSTDPDPTMHPIRGLERRIDTEALSADVVLFAGDLGHQADPDGIGYAWSELQRLKTKLNAGLLLATAGNHDVDSRWKHNDFDAKGRLQGLEPAFPLEDVRSSNEYWARHFTIIERPDWRAIVLNSSAYHGYRDENEHGRIAASTLRRLRERLDETERKDIQILLCHHHPVAFGRIDTDDSSQMEGGQQLLDTLADHGRWLIVHGHKHYPYLQYASGGASAPAIFSAGSLSAKPYPSQAGHARNQFYLMEFPLAVTRSLKIPWAARFRSWVWTERTGWSPSGDDAGLPADGGFGWRIEPGEIADRVLAVVGESGGTTIRWADLLFAMPQLEFCIPRDLEQVLIELDARGCGLPGWKADRPRTPHEVTLP